MCIIFYCDNNFKIHMLLWYHREFFNFTSLRNIWSSCSFCIPVLACTFVHSAFFLSIRISSSFIKWSKALFYPYSLQSLVTTLLQTGNCLGEATIRFLPKLRSLRPIANLGRQPPATAKSVIFVSKTLDFNLTS